MPSRKYNLETRRRKQAELKARIAAATAQPRVGEQLHVRDTAHTALLEDTSEGIVLSFTVVAAGIVPGRREILLDRAKIESPPTELLQ